MSGAEQLTSAFFDAAAPASIARELADLDVELRARIAAGRAAWPDIDVPDSGFAAYLGARSTSGLPAAAHAADLYIACACTLEAFGAVAAFQRRYRDEIARAVSRTDASPAFADDVMQVLSERLFVGSAGKSPAIGEYAGLSTLRGWLVTIAKRTALNMRRRKDDRGHDEVASGVAVLGAAGGPELALFKARYKREFEASIRVALASLGDAERSLLLLHLVNGVTLNQLAVMHGVSRATIARRLAATRDALFDATRANLVGRLQLSPSEYASVLALVRSQLELSVVAAATGQPAER